MKTKPIQLPLSTDKIYVLVDELIDEGDFAYPIDINLLKNPFNPTHVEDEYLWFGDNCIACVTGEVNISSYREVIQETNMNTDEIAVTQEEEAFDNMQPDGGFVDSQNWSHGDICVFENEGAIVVGWHPEHPVLVIDSDAKGFIGITDLSLLSKPETPQQREERERLEAAIELHDIANLSYYEGCLPFGCNWDDAGDKVKNMWLAIVDKTNYRKQ